MYKTNNKTKYFSYIITIVNFFENVYNIIKKSEMVSTFRKVEQKTLCYLRPMSGLRNKNVYFGVESKMATKHEFYGENMLDFFLLYSI